MAMGAITARLKGHLADVGMIAPLALYLLGFTLVPVVSTILLSLTDATSELFPVLINYRSLLAQTDFPYAVFNTIVLTILGVALELSVGLGLALALTSIRRGRSLVRTSLLIPIGVPTLVSAIVMTYIFASNGYLNEIITKLGIVTVPVDWKSGGSVTYAMIILADMWKVTPLVILMLLAGLEAIPDDLYESAQVDGAGPWQTFWHITLPLLRPTITMVVILRAIDAFRIFELPMVLVGRSFPVIGTHAYYEYVKYNNPQASAAASTFLLTMVLCFVIVYLLVVERRRRPKVKIQLEAT